MGKGGGESEGKETDRKTEKVGMYRLTDTASVKKTVCTLDFPGFFGLFVKNL